MSANDRKKKKKKHRHNRKKRMPAGRKILLIVAAVLAALVIFSTLFSVEDVVVSGNTRYTDEAIQSMCMESSLSGNTLLFYLFNRRIDLGDMPYLECVDTEMIDRNTLHLSVTERIPIGRIRINAEDYYFDKDGKVLEIRNVGEEPNGTSILVEGIEVKPSKPGETMISDQDDFLTMLSVLNTLSEKYGLNPDIVRYDEADGMTLVFGSVRVLLGQDLYLEEKVARVDAILPNLEGMAGTLHLEDYTEGDKDILFNMNETGNGDGADTRPHQGE